MAISFVDYFSGTFFRGLEQGTLTDNAVEKTSEFPEVNEQGDVGSEASMT